MRARRFALLLLSFVSFMSLVSCASYWTRKDCEKTNWFQHGQSVAMRGERLNADQFLHQCRKVEAEIDETQLDLGFKKGMETYCQPESVYQLGKRGEFFSAEMCDGERPTTLKRKHDEGVRDYCQKSNGFNAGSQGKKYNNICPKNLEAEFLPEFNKGRKRYLTAVAAQKENEIDDIDKEVQDLERRKTTLMIQMQSLGMGTVISRERKYDPVSRSQKDQLVITEDEAKKNERERLGRDIESADYQIGAKRDQQRNLRKEIRDIQTEIAGL